MKTVCSMCAGREPLIEVGFDRLSAHARDNGCIIRRCQKKIAVVLGYSKPNVAVCRLAFCEDHGIATSRLHGYYPIGEQSIAIVVSARLAALGEE